MNNLYSEIDQGKKKADQNYDYLIIKYELFNFLF